MSPKKQRQAALGGASSSGTSGAPGLGNIEPMLARRIAEALTSQESPLFDRMDLLQQAATLARVGNANTAVMAEVIFRFLSPHLGEDPPRGVTEQSSTSALKAALKAWRLPTTAKKKAELWERLQEQVADTVRPPPRTCLVSAATRIELLRWRHQRISQTKAKEIFNLSPADLRGLHCIMERTGSIPAKTYRLSEVKRKALQRFGSWAELSRRQRYWAMWTPSSANYKPAPAEPGTAGAAPAGGVSAACQQQEKQEEQQEQEQL